MSQGSDCPAGSVLIVDDERTILEILEQFLGGRGYRVFTAQSASEALHLAVLQHFDAAILDLKLPDGIGTDLLASIAKTQPGISCIIMTAFASVESTIEALRMDAFDYILKPFDLARIGEVVDAAIQSSKLKRERGALIERLEEHNKKLEEKKEKLDKEFARMNEELRRANDSLRQHVTRLRVLYQMGRDISSSENWSDALDRFLMAFCRYVDGEGASLLLFSDNARTLKVRATYQLETEVLEKFVKDLLLAHSSDTISTEIFCLDSLLNGESRSCLTMDTGWLHTAVPLLYRNRWLGFLILRKGYRSLREYSQDYHFISTIQTILTEEVANAATISRLRNLKNFNETLLENMNGGVLATDNSGRITFMNERARALSGLASKELSFDELFENPFGSRSLFDYIISSPEENLSFECMI